MSVLNTLPAPVVQMGFVEKIVDQQQNQPHALMQAGQEATREMLRAEAQRIAKSEAPEHSKKVRDKGERQQRSQTGGQQASGGKSGLEPGETPEADAESTVAPPPNPWAGNLVNLKI